MTQVCFPDDIIPPWFSRLVWGMNKGPVGGRSSLTYSHPIDIITIIKSEIKMRTLIPSRLESAML
jgi:hypothetical protein